MSVHVCVRARISGAQVLLPDRRWDLKRSAWKVIFPRDFPYLRKEFNLQCNFSVKLFYITTELYIII